MSAGSLVQNKPERRNAGISELPHFVPAAGGGGGGGGVPATTTLTKFSRENPDVKGDIGRIH